MKPRARKTGATGATEKKPAFAVPADFTPKQTQVAWEAFVKAQPSIAEQPKAKPEISMSNHLANVREDAAKRPRTRGARPIGKLPLALEQGGIDAVLWPWFRRWIENPHNQSFAEWQAIKDKRRFLVLLVVSLVLGNRREAKALKGKAEAVAPVLARRVLPLLRRRISKLTLEDYTAVTRNPSQDGDKFSARAHDKRAKLRAGSKTLPKFLRAP